MADRKQKDSREVARQLVRTLNMRYWGLDIRAEIFKRFLGGVLVGAVEGAVAL